MPFNSKFDALYEDKLVGVWEAETELGLELHRFELLFYNKFLNEINVNIIYKTPIDITIHQVISKHYDKYYDSLEDYKADNWKSISFWCLGKDIEISDDLEIDNLDDLNKLIETEPLNGGIPNSEDDYDETYNDEYENWEYNDPFNED